MKTIIFGAFALALAVPAAAQTAPATDPHAGHGQQQTMDHSQHKGMDHAKHADMMHDCKECCEKMKEQGGKMECMEKMNPAKKGASGHQAGEAGHNHAH